MPIIPKKILLFPKTEPVVSLFHRNNFLYSYAIIPLHPLNTYKPVFYYSDENQEYYPPPEYCQLSQVGWPGVEREREDFDVGWTHYLYFFINSMYHLEALPRNQNILRAFRRYAILIVTERTKHGKKSKLIWNQWLHPACPVKLFRAGNSVGSPVGVSPRLISSIMNV